MESYPSPRHCTSPFQQLAPSMSSKPRWKRQPFISNDNPVYDQVYLENGEHARSARYFEPQTCYNCGAPDHWAQDCPEPRGSVSVAADSCYRPSKRRKTGKLGHNMDPYSPSPRYKHHSAQSRGYGNFPTSQQTSATYSYGPPTPISTFPQNSNSWQRSPQFASPVRPYPSHLAKGSQFPGPISSHNAHDHGYFSPPRENINFNRDRHHKNQNCKRYLPRYGRSRFPSRRPCLTDDGMINGPPDYTLVEDMKSFNGQPAPMPPGSQIIWRPAEPVAQPLPSTFSGPDEVISLPSLTTLQAGMSVSKYVLNKGPDEFEGHIRDTQDWPLMKDDPIFREIATDCRLISVEELTAKRIQISKSHGHHVFSKVGDREVGENALTGDNQDASVVNNAPPCGDQVEDDKHRGDEEEELRGDHEITFSPHEGEDNFLQLDGAPRYSEEPEFQLLGDRSNDCSSSSPSHYRTKKHHRWYGLGSQDRTQSKVGRMKGKWGEHHLYPDLPPIGRSDRRAGKAPYEIGQNSQHLSKQHSHCTRGQPGPEAPFRSCNHDRGRTHQRQSSDSFRYQHYQGKKPGQIDSPTNKSHLQRVSGDRKRTRSGDSPEDRGEPRRQDDDLSPQNKHQRPEGISAYSRRW